MTTLVEKAQKQHDDTQARLRPYLMTLLQRLFITYDAPLLAALFVSTVGAMLVSRALPDSTTSLLALVVNVFVLFYGWRALEKRTRATAAFALYAQAARERRTLAKLIAQTKAGDTLSHDALARQAQAYTAAAEAFMAILHD